MPHHDSLRALIQTLHLPAGYGAQADRYLQPLAAQIAARYGGNMLIIGINGAQGSGKSTLARVLACLLRQYDLHTAVLSLDDFYLPGRARASLAAGVHPLLRTRGVPGTHDVPQGERLFLRLGRMGATDCIRLPCFDKGRDEPCDEASRPLWQGKVDVLIFEGWCVGTPAQPEAELQQPVNALEAEQDRHGRWRAYVNRRLATDYQHWFSCLDMLLYLQVPSMQDAFRWRLRQEQQLPPDRRMTPAQLQGFMQHFERLTLHAMRQLPHSADIVLTLDAAQRITHVRNNPCGDGPEDGS